MTRLADYVQPIGPITNIILAHEVPKGLDHLSSVTAAVMAGPARSPLFLSDPTERV